MRSTPRTLEIYRDSKGVEPFSRWLESLKDARNRYRVVARLDRVELGNLGDHKMLGGGLFELRLHFGPGYRVYCGEINSQIILLLAGGDKESQARDIGKARQYWIEEKERRQ